MAIKLVVLDVDGVLTDGRITYDSSGREVKFFSVKDGYGIVRALKEGIKIMVVSGRSSPLVQKRCEELGVELLFQGVQEKLPLVEEKLRELGISFEETAAMGDDVPDIPLLKRVAISGAPKDAVPEVKVIATFVSRSGGGMGAVREFIDFILRKNRE
jgi:3-deoxy-D-manno-octulosonate 8-phosphate phosphatase (KDO 8-P phosphatase)